MGTNLRDRATASAAQRGLATTTGAEVERKDPPTLADQIRGMHAQFEMAMPRGAEARQLIRDALSLLKTSKDLHRCDVQSVLGGLMTFAQLGLRPGVLGHGWLIPFKKRAQTNGQWHDTWQAQIVIGYKGYAELVHRSGQIDTMVGRPVHEHDEFDMEYGITDRLVHKPRMKGDRGPVVGYYAIIKYQGGGYVFWHMTRDEVLEWRAEHAMSTRRDRKGRPERDENGNTTGSGPWYDEEGPAGGTGLDQMGIKTCFLRAQKWAPKGLDLTLARAAEVDGAVRFDVDVDPDAMLGAEHPTAGDTVEGELVDDEPAGPAADAPPVHDVNLPVPLQTEFPAVVGKGTDDPASDAQQKAMSAILGKAGVKADAERHAVLSRIAGRTTPITSASALTKREASQIIEHLNRWQDDLVLVDQVAAVLAAAAPAPAGEKLPDVGTRAWHDAGHPNRSAEGKVVTVPQLLNGDCGICEQPE